MHPVPLPRKKTTHSTNLQKVIGVDADSAVRSRVRTVVDTLKLNHRIHYLLAISAGFGHTWSVWTKHVDAASVPLRLTKNINSLASLSHIPLYYVIHPSFNIRNSKVGLRCPLWWPTTTPRFNQNSESSLQFHEMKEKTNVHPGKASLAKVKDKPCLFLGLLNPRHCRTLSTGCPLIHSTDVDGWPK